MITTNVKDTNQLIEQRKVQSKITQDTLLNDKEKDQWVIDRRKVITATNTVVELEAASDTIEKMQEAFEALDSNKLTLDRIDSILTDLETLLAISEGLKNL